MQVNWKTKFINDLWFSICGHISLIAGYWIAYVHHALLLFEMRISVMCTRALRHWIAPPAVKKIQCLYLGTVYCMVNGDWQQIARSQVQLIFFSLILVTRQPLFLSVSTHLFRSYEIVHMKLFWLKKWAQIIISSTFWANPRNTELKWHEKRFG